MKTIELCASRRFNHEFAGLEAGLYANLFMRAFKKRPCDMYVFETKDDTMNIRLAGYLIEDGTIGGELVEDEIVDSFTSLPTEKFWCKVDDYGEKFVATFLFPEEY